MVYSKLKDERSHSYEQNQQEAQRWRVLAGITSIQKRFEMVCFCESRIRADRMTQIGYLEHLVGLKIDVESCLSVMDPALQTAWVCGSTDLHISLSSCSLLIKLRSGSNETRKTAIPMTDTILFSLRIESSLRSYGSPLSVAPKVFSSDQEPAIAEWPWPNQVRRNPIEVLKCINSLLKLVFPSCTRHSFCCCFPNSTKYLVPLSKSHQAAI